MGKQLTPGEKVAKACAEADPRTLSKPQQDAAQAWKNAQAARRSKGGR